jgi:hypothetical protein
MLPPWIPSCAGKALFCIKIPLLLLTYQDMLQWLRGHQLTCPSKSWLHMECPGCGLQRSFLALLEGDLQQSLRLYPATLPLLFVLAFTPLHLWFKFKQGAQVIKFAFLLAALVIFVFYILKIIHHQI